MAIDQAIMAMLSNLLWNFEQFVFENSMIDWQRVKPWLLDTA